MGEEFVCTHAFEMFSPEISDLESFIDSYQTSVDGNGNHAGESQNEGNQMMLPSARGRQNSSSSDLASFAASSPSPHSASGTEVWGDRSRGGVNWSAKQANNPRDEFEHRLPPVQERLQTWIRESGEQGSEMNNLSSHQQQLQSAAIKKALEYERQKQMVQEQMELKAFFTAWQSGKLPPQQQQQLGGFNSNMNNHLNGNLMNTPPPPLPESILLKLQQQKQQQQHQQQQQQQQRQMRQQNNNANSGASYQQQQQQQRPSSDYQKNYMMEQMKQQMSTDTQYLQQQHHEQERNPNKWTNPTAAVAAAAGNYIDKSNAFNHLNELDAIEINNLMRMKKGMKPLVNNQTFDVSPSTFNRNTSHGSMHRSSPPTLDNNNGSGSADASRYGYISGGGGEFPPQQQYHHQQQQHHRGGGGAGNGVVLSKDAAQLNDLDVNELRRQINSGELVVVRKDDLLASLSTAAAAGKTADSKAAPSPTAAAVTAVAGDNTKVKITKKYSIGSDVSAGSRETNTSYNAASGSEKSSLSRQTSTDDNVFRNVEQRTPKSKPPQSPGFYNKTNGKSRADDDKNWRRRDDDPQPPSRKHSYENLPQRKKSAADEDKDWRRRDSTDTPQDSTRRSSTEKFGSFNNNQQQQQQQQLPHEPKSKEKVFKATVQAEHSENKSKTNDKQQQQQQKQERVNKPQGKKDNNQMESQPHHQRGAITTSMKQSPRQQQQHAVSSDAPRHISSKSKRSIQSWIQSENKDTRRKPLDEIVKDLTIVEGNIDDVQLAAFMEKIQNNANTEGKLRTYAEDLCKRAIKHPSFGYGASLLCNRMSWMMIEHGTKFRSMVFEQMQKQYGEREVMFQQSLNSHDMRWYGFIHFLFHLYLNVLIPEVGKRFHVLVKPVFKCLQQVLTTKNVSGNHMKCFGEMFALAGMKLEEDDKEEMERLMIQMRDCVLTSESKYTRETLLRCIRMYATRWGSVKP